jgi:hypothetical protein
MRRLRVLAPLGLGLALLFGAAFSGKGVARVSAADDVTDPARATEVRRIRTHFDSALVELESRDIGALDDAQRANRRLLLATLRAYRDRGEFPHNYDFAGEAVPYFIDRKTGTLCAVAHLLASTGRQDIVDRVARGNNNVRVGQLSADTAFVAWLDANGVTLDEAARIQVPYMQPSPIVTATRAKTPAALPIALGASALAGTWNAFANADGHSRMANVLGFGAGLATVGIGASQIGRQNVSQAMSVTTAAVGGLSVALSARSFHRHNVIAAAEREAARKSRMRPSRRSFRWPARARACRCPSDFDRRR